MQTVDSILILSRVLRILEPVTAHSLSLQEAVTRVRWCFQAFKIVSGVSFQMYGYTNIFIHLVNQCMLDETSSESSSTKEPSKGEDATNPETYEEHVNFVSLRCIVLSVIFMACAVESVSIRCEMRVRCSRAWRLYVV